MDAKLKAAKLLMWGGGLAFFVCCAVGLTTELRVFSSSTFHERSSQRSEPVEVKGDTYYLEPTNARVFNISQTAILFSILFSLLGGAYVEKRKREDK